MIDCAAAENLCKFIELFHGARFKYGPGQIGQLGGKWHKWRKY